MFRNDQRRHFRIPMGVPVTLVSAGNRHASGTLVDLTVFGARVSSPAVTVGKGDEITLRFLANGVNVEPQGQVTGVYPDRSVGVRFTQVEPQQQLHIATALYLRMQALLYRPQR